MMRTNLRRKLVLLYRLGTDTEKGQKTHEILKALGISVKDILPEQLENSLGLLAGYGGFTPAAPFAGPYPQEEFLVMRDIRDKRLDTLLARLREEGISIPLKAVLTDTNKSWSALSLLRELGREHKMMEAWQKLRRAVQAGEERLAPAALEEGKRLLTAVSAQEEVSAEAMEAAALALEKALEA